MIVLDKKIGINLTKGSSISLVKDEKKLEKVCVGINWGKIKKKTLGIFATEDNVDLDASVALFDDNKTKIDVVYFNHLTSKDGSIKHSGDDREGDNKADDFDNEVITVDLLKVSPSVSSIVFFLNSYNEKDFETIPYTKIRIFEGTPNRVESVFATFSLSSEPAFRGKISMVMGKLVRENKGWKFYTIGQESFTRTLAETVEEIKERHL